MHSINLIAGLLMPQAPLPDDDHVIRYVRKRALRRDEDDNVIGILPDALRHREGETYLSATWIENFDSDYEAGLKQAADAIRRQLTVKPRDGFAAGKVEDIREVCSSFDTRVRILHEPLPPTNTGYCAIRGLREAELDLLDALASEAFIDTRVSKDIQPWPTQ